MRFTWAGKPNEMGLGGAAVSLAQARDKADAARKLVAAGVNPIEYRRTAQTPQGWKANVRPMRGRTSRGKGFRMAQRKAQGAMEDDTDGVGQAAARTAG